MGPAVSLNQYLARFGKRVEMNTCVWELGSRGGGSAGLLFYWLLVKTRTLSPSLPWRRPLPPLSSRVSPPHIRPLRGLGRRIVSGIARYSSYSTTFRSDHGDRGHPSFCWPYPSVDWGVDSLFLISFRFDFGLLWPDLLVRLFSDSFICVKSDFAPLF